MVAIKVSGFGGMVPSTDLRLLPDTAASYAANIWLYSGAPEGLPTPTQLHACTLPKTNKVYRLPAAYSNSAYLYGSYWMEFEDPNTDVVRASVFGDEFDRYYWVSPSLAPRYSPRSRIEAGDPPWLLGIPDPLAPTLAVVDTVPPQVQSIEVPADVPTTIMITFNEELDQGSVPSTTAFTATGKTINSVAIAGALVTITVNAAFVYGDAPVIGYTAPGTNDLKDPAGNVVVSFSHGLIANANGSDNIANKIPSGVTTTKVVVSRAYVTTYVSAYGEEGPPSPAALANGNQDAIWRLTLPAAAPGDLGVVRDLTRVRIYRTITAVGGTARFFLVADLPISTTTYDDTIADVVIASSNILQTEGWTAPPADLLGFVMMPNGIMAGWRANEVWFSEPFRPHAWPVAYVQTTEFPIVGLGVSGQAVVACTQGYPVVMTGTSPLYISAVTLTTTEPCLSRLSIMSSPEGVYYASPNGLILVQGGASSNITREIISKDGWQQLTKLTALCCARFGTAYYAFGTVRYGVFEPTAFETTAFAQEDFSGAYLGVLLDPQNARAGFSMLSSTDPTVSVQNDTWSGELFVIRENIVYWLNQADTMTPKETFTWKSKIFQTNDRKNLGAMRIFFEVDPEVPPGPDYGTVTLWGDGRQVMQRLLVKSGDLIRPPSGYKANFWQFEVVSRAKLLSVHLASSVKELEKV